MRIGWFKIIICVTVSVHLKKGKEGGFLKLNKYSQTRDIMGNLCKSKDANTKQIDKLARVDKQNYQRKIKLLLLGAGESGKSTFFKQMRLLYSKEKLFTDVEKKNYKDALFKSMLSDLAQIVAHMQEKDLLDTEELKLAGRDVMNAFKDAREKLKKKNASLSIEETVRDVLLFLWENPNTQQVWENRAVLQVQDSLEYFMLKDNLMRISNPSYDPTNHDVLRIRIRTLGIIQEEFIFEGANLEMYDVGGQKSERRKWIEAFDNVTSVIFIAAISEYNQVMFEDSLKSRQDDAIELFKEQINLNVWNQTPFILFLNKTDLFKEKLTKIPFRVTEPAEDSRNVKFEGPHIDLSKEYSIDGSDKEFEECYIAACNYLQGTFESQAQSQGRSQMIYTNFTNSTDTEQMVNVMNACKDIILKEQIFQGGWMSSNENDQEQSEQGI